MSLTATASRTEAPVAATPAAKDRGSARRGFLPLIVDVAVPLVSFYLLKDGLGLSTVAALGLSSVLPAVRTLWSAVRDRSLNGLAALILVVNVAGLVLGSVAGDPRLMLAKDSAISSVVGIGVLVSVLLGKPMMTAAMAPFVIKGDTAKSAAWDRLISGSERFRRAERTFSAVWGVTLLGECVVRVVGAYTLPVDTMVWLGTVIMIASMTLGFLVSGALAVVPMQMMLKEELCAGTDTK
ncbi:VC0807 family protein [Streptomyces sp. NPDC005551]|uniref:VC0807 family protein n=1 Tax=unclassified Streptomyces TaxID=2593676 RepID=UPI0033E6521D